MSDGAKSPTVAASVEIDEKLASQRGEDKEEACSEEETTSPSSGVLSIPDGGWDAWKTIVGAWMVQFCTFGYINAFGVFQDYYTRQFLSNRSASDISWIGSFQLFMQYAPGLLVGRAFDDGYFHHLMLIGSTIYVFSMFMLSLAQQDHYYQVFLSQAVGMGVGQGLVFLPSLSIVGHHFKRKRSLATGVVVSGAGAGGIVFPIMLNKLIQESNLGFANSVRATAALVAGMLLLANCLMRTRLSPTKDRPYTLKKDLKVILSDAAYTVSVAGAFLIAVGLYFPYFYLQLYAVKHGVDAQIAFYSIAMLNAGSVAGRLLPNFLADYIGVYNMLLPCTFASTCLLFSIFGIKTSAGVIVLALLHGFTSGAYVSLIPSLLAQLSSHIGELGLRIGVAFSVVAVAMLIGTPVEGALLQVGDHLAWWKAIVFCGVCASVGTVLMTFSRTIFARRKGQHRV